MYSTTAPVYRQQTNTGAVRALVIILIAALGVFAIGGAMTLADMTDSAFLGGLRQDQQTFDDASPASNASTPVSAWKKGETPFLYQRDPAWENKAYAGETIGTSGCGPTCLSMIYVTLTGRTDYSPERMCAFSEAGGYIEDGMTRWALLDEGASQLGLSSRIVPATPKSIEKELAQGHPIILSMGKGEFTDIGHFIVVTDLTSDGKLLIRDPNSPERTHVSWDAKRVCDQARSAWAFSLK